MNNQAQSHPTTDEDVNRLVRLSRLQEYAGKHRFEGIMRNHCLEKYGCELSALNDVQLDDVQSTIVSMVGFLKEEAEC